MYILKDVKYKNILNIKHLTIPSGKITCIVGKSGSGKTTLLRLLNKLNDYDEGEILFNEELLHTIDSVQLRRRVTMMSQTPVVFSGNIRDNLLIGLKFSNKPLICDAKLREILRLVNLDKSLDEPCDKLSGGEKQRLALGRVLILEPEVLLLDEPSSSLDDQTEQLVIEKVVQYVTSKHKTLIMVTHSKQIAKEYADILIELENGQMKEETND